MDYPDVLNLPREDLLEEFCKLFDRHQELKDANDADNQKIHELKRALATATAAQEYLSQELDQYTNPEFSAKENEAQKIQTDYEEIRKKYTKLEASFQSLQQDFNAMAEENLMLTQNLEEAVKRKDNTPVIVEMKTSEEDLARIQIVENENMDLLQKMEEYEERIVRYTMTIAESEKNVEILEDQINCLEENLQCKRNDLEEKLQILESTQEALMEANAKIAMLSAAPDANDRKGNSLFAEVDDQRQAMKQLLNNQKKSYIQMKKIYNESEHEIRRLKRENIAMHTELEACSSIFCNADKVYQEKLNDRVRSLMNQNDELERKLNWTQGRLKELSREKGVLWLDSMLSFCKKETDDLKKQLHSVRIQKASLEEQLRSSQQEMARWRFESLKSRCVLLDREQLLVDNKISFKPVHAVEFRITEKEQQEARPRIVNKRASELFEKIERRSMTPQKVGCKTNKAASGTPLKNGDVKAEQENIVEDVTADKNKTDQNNDSVVLINEVSNIAINVDDSIKVSEKQASPEKDKIKQEIIIAAETKEEQIQESTNEVMHTAATALCPNFAIYTDSPSPPTPLKTTENKENSLDMLPEQQEEDSFPKINDKFSKFTLNPPSPMRPSQKSILTKQRDLFSKEPSKNVKFCSQEVIVHNLSPNTANTPLQQRTDNNLADNTPCSTTEDVKVSSNKATGGAKQMRPKSQIVVRRVILNSKHD